MQFHNPPTDTEGLSGMTWFFLGLAIIALVAAGIEELFGSTLG